MLVRKSVLLSLVFLLTSCESPNKKPLSTINILEGTSKKSNTASYGTVKRNTPSTANALNKKELLDRQNRIKKIFAARSKANGRGRAVYTEPVYPERISTATKLVASNQILLTHDQQQKRTSDVVISANTSNLPIVNRQNQNERTQSGNLAVLQNSANQQQKSIVVQQEQLTKKQIPTQQAAADGRQSERSGQTQNVNSQKPVFSVTSTIEDGNAIIKIRNSGAQALFCSIEYEALASGTWEKGCSVDGHFNCHEVKALANTSNVYTAHYGIRVTELRNVSVKCDANAYLN